MTKRYEHTQVGYLIIVSLVAAMVLISIILAYKSFNWIAIAVLIVLVVALSLFRSLTVSISEETLENNGKASSQDSPDATSETGSDKASKEE